MRSTRNQPFCWQEKKVFRILRKNYSGAELVKLRCLYGTITEIDSDFNSQEIKYYTKTISTYSGLSTEWIPGGLRILEGLKILRVEEDRERGRYKGKRLVFTPENLEEIPVKPVTGKAVNGKTTNGETDTSKDIPILEDISLSEDILYKERVSFSPPQESDNQNQKNPFPTYNHKKSIFKFVNRWNELDLSPQCRGIPGDLEILDGIKKYSPEEVLESFDLYKEIISDKERYYNPVKYPTGLSGFLKKGVAVYCAASKPRELFLNKNYENLPPLDERLQKMKKELEADR